MDSLATGLASIVVLAIPFWLWLRLKGRARYERELAEIRKLVAERSRGLSELHSRLDALEKQDSRQDSAASKEGTADRPWLMIVGRKAANEKGAAANRYLATLETVHSGLGHGMHFYRFDKSSIILCSPESGFDEPLNAEDFRALWNLCAKYYTSDLKKPSAEDLRTLRDLNARYITSGLKKPRTLEWSDYIGCHRWPNIEVLRRKSGWRRGGQRPLAGSSY